ncbi:hypothetical protein VTN77DRAFT_8814 [Rasamsonia byssochlamydoides]|uniref:uncharacterized protein n=1 Tax=Rasamsonia byssochlamydoides TaxID=89139 RepID=UPI0037425678
MAGFCEQLFFGGAIAGAIPEGWIDASDVRQVPDHQEIFLSRTTLSNLIVEINERVPRDQVLKMLTEQSVPPNGAHSNAQTEDIAAALYHLRDICDEGDTMQVINTPHPVTLQRFNPPVPAYAGLVSFTSPKRQRAGGQAAPVSIDGDTASSSAAGPQLSTYSCHFLLVRLEAQNTDLLVFVNVPHEEFDLQGDPRALSKEEEMASNLLGKFVETLEVRNWGLFGC